MTASGFSSRLGLLATYVLVGIVALVPRIANLGQFVTVDEADFWLARSDLFLNALRTGDWAATAISTHPGVTTMWSGAIGILLRQPLIDWHVVRGMTVPGAIALMRLPLVLAHAGAVVLAFHLLRKLVSFPIALLAALLWACDPFIVAYSRLLHVDAPLTTFASISILAALCAWRPARAPSLAFAALSGAFGGLALLSKSPALLVPPFVTLIALAAWFVPALPVSERTRSTFRATVVVPLAVCSLTALAVMLVLWPAMWAAPFKIVEQLRIGIEVEGAQPHMLGNYFLGQPDPAPGVLFYPVALALRLTPWTLAGVLLLPCAWRATARQERHSYAVLALFVILFTVAMTLFEKKFNRYLVPVFPMLDILAAAGIIATGDLLADLFGRARRSARRSVEVALVGLSTLAALVNIAWWHPYSIAAFNQALGGANAGAYAFVIGWGEGYERVAQWLNQQPDITGVRTVSREPQVQNPYMKDGADASPPENGVLPDKTGYLVVYVGQTQRGAPSPPFGDYYGHAIPLETIVIHGVDYAWIYQVAPPVDTAIDAHFNQALVLHGIVHDRKAKQLQLIWQAHDTLPAAANLFVHVLSADGTRVSQLDIALDLPGWKVGRYQTTTVPISIPADAAPGAYRVVAGVYDPASGARYELGNGPALDPAIDGPHALLLTTVDVP